MWYRGIPLAEIAKKLHYSFSTLAQLRHSLGLRKRYGHEDDQTLPSPEVICIRCGQEQTNWTDTERRLRWRGPPHTVYSSIQGYGDSE
jgi:hypothetical protein